MSELSMFSKELANSDLFKKMLAVNSNLSNGGGSGLTTRRISLKGGKFRQMVNGEQISVSKDNEMNVVIVDAAPISRTYYEGVYDPSNPAPPACWSNDTNTKRPAEAVPAETRQASSCNNCPKDIKGSGQGNSRACRFGQRLAIAIEGDLDKVYQLQLPATSIFGDAKGDKYPMGAYARLLSANNAPASAVVTTMYFDEEAEVPKLYFKPARPLNEEELQQILKLQESEETKRAIEFTVAQTDKLIASDAPAKKEAAPSLFKEEVAEPVVVEKKAKVAEASSLADIIKDVAAEWDDE